MVEHWKFWWQHTCITFSSWFRKEETCYRCIFSTEPQRSNVGYLWYHGEKWAAHYDVLETAAGGDEKTFEQGTTSNEGEQGSAQTEVHMGHRRRTESHHESCKEEVHQEGQAVVEKEYN